MNYHDALMWAFYLLAFCVALIPAAIFGFLIEKYLERRFK